MRAQPPIVIQTPVAASRVNSVEGNLAGINLINKIWAIHHSIQLLCAVRLDRHDRLHNKGLTFSFST